MTDPMNITLPDLSTWHRVPAGATIPAFSAYASKGTLMVELRGRFEDITVIRDNSYYTEFPVTPPLPTEEGATILASGNNLPPHTLLTRDGGRWLTRNDTTWCDGQIAAWAPVTIGEVVVMQ